MTTTTTPSSPGTTPATTPPTGQVVPFPNPMWGGGQPPWLPPGCCPPGGMDALMKCYMDVQAASCFIAQVMIDQINNNPAVAAAIIAAIEKSGSSIPLIGVTNGSNAQPGQVGEFISYSATVPYTTTAPSVPVPVSMGVLQPGDWDCWYFASFATDMTIAHIYLDPATSAAGFSNALFSAMDDASGTAFWLNSTTARASLAVPTLVVVDVSFQGTSGSGQSTIQFNARRRR